jgi:hypothetical protein
MRTFAALELSWLLLAGFAACSEPFEGDGHGQGGNTGAGGSGGMSTGGTSGSAGTPNDSGSTTPDGDSSITDGDSGSTSVDSGSLFGPDGGPAACPALAATPCWQQLVREYVNVGSCFKHRSLCDINANSGDGSECGLWTDMTRSVCTWPDGTEVLHDSATNTSVFKDTAGSECYRKEATTVAGNSQFVLTFDSRVYKVTSDVATRSWRFDCPDGSFANASEAEFRVCNFRGVCCAYPSRSCENNFSP